MKSRKTVFKRAAKKMDEGYGLCIFPEGGVTDDESIVLDKFKSGAFRLAASKDVEIIPVSYPDNKRHLPYDYKKGYPGVLRAEIHPFLRAKNDSSEAIEELEKECFETVLSGLQSAQVKSLINEIR